MQEAQLCLCHYRPLLLFKVSFHLINLDWNQNSKILRFFFAQEFGSDGGKKKKKNLITHSPFIRNTSAHNRLVRTCVGSRGWKCWIPLPSTSTEDLNAPVFRFGVNAGVLMLSVLRYSLQMPFGRRMYMPRHPSAWSGLKNGVVKCTFFRRSAGPAGLLLVSPCCFQGKKICLFRNGLLIYAFWPLKTALIVKRNGDKWV